MTFLIVALIALAFAIVAFKKFDLATLILIGALPLYVVRFSFLNIPSTLLEILILILFAVWLYKNYQTIFKNLKNNLVVKKISNRYPFDWELIAWLIVSLLAAVVAGLSFKSLGIWRAYFFEPALLFIIFVNVFSTKEKVIKAAYALSVSALVISLIATFQYLTGLFIPNDFWAQAASRRATSLFPYPNAVALYLAPSIFFLSGTLPTFYNKNKKIFSFVVVSILFSLLAILFAKSEGAIFAIASVYAIGLVLISKRSRQIFLVLFIALILGLTIVPAFKDYFIDRVSLNNFSGQVRKIQWRETINMLYQGRILTGAGLANYQTAVAPFHQVGFFFNKEKLPQAEFTKRVNEDPSYRTSHWQPLETYLYPHNIILNFWSELGLLGLLLFIWLVVRYLQIGVKAYCLALKDKDQFAWVIFGLLLAMLAIIIHGIVDVPYFKNDLAILFWLWLALVGVSYKILNGSPLSRG
ncbi:MAG: O-antigen ligase family protein [Candidatus Falkowbacteria bacterium]|nr:O-antigen ligase family protein [Candidatus Falkowbacteria bacterium]